MKNFGEIRVSVGFLFLVSAAWLFDVSGLVSAAVPAIFFHEAGHMLAICALGGQIRCVSLELSGLRIDYRGYLTPGGELFAAFSGPSLGAVYALAAAMAGRYLQSDFLKCSSGVSMVLTVFNLLPSMPLDGGRILKIILESLVGYNAADIFVFCLSVFIAAALMLIGLLCVYEYGILGAMHAGIWILISNMQSIGLVKKHRV